jgi:hypothetical protein
VRAIGCLAHGVTGNRTNSFDLTGPRAVAAWHARLHTRMQSPYHAVGVSPETFLLLLRQVNSVASLFADLQAVEGVAADGQKHRSGSSVAEAAAVGVPVLHSALLALAKLMAVDAAFCDAHMRLLMLWTNNT